MKKDNPDAPNPQIPKNELLDMGNGSYQLARNGNPLICPYKPPMQQMVKSALGQTAMQYVHSPCGNHCPLFNIERHPLGTTVVHLNCGVAPTKTELEIIQPRSHDETPTLKLT
jgi:hypothetical protein